MGLRKVCMSCYRHVCPCGWYKVLSRDWVGVLACGRCGTDERVTVREVAHYSAGADGLCPYRATMPAVSVVKRRCQFCERERDEAFMDYAPGEGWECRDAARCEATQLGAELDMEDRAA
jgi:hypothetical protein